MKSTKTLYLVAATALSIAAAHAQQFENYTLLPQSGNNFSVTVLPDGDQVITYPLGQGFYTTQFPDGSTATTYPLVRTVPIFPNSGLYRAGR